MRLIFLKKRAVLVAVVAAMIGAALLLACRAVARSVEAEKNLHAVVTVCGALCRYCEHHRQWPRSADQLSEDCQFDGGMYKWPDDRAEVLRRVSVCFGPWSTSDAVARHHEVAPLVKSRGVSFARSESQKVERLIECISSHAR